MATSALARFRDWTTNFPGSTRGVGLMRIGLVLLGWAELGEGVQPHRSGRPLLALLFYVSTLLSLVGYRASYATLAAAVSYLLVIVYVPNQMLHHTYLLAVATLLLSLTPCGASFSLDRVLAVRRARAAKAEPPKEEGNLWALRLIALQLSAVFFWSGYNKLTLGTAHLQTAFLSGDRIEQLLVYYYSGLPVHEPGWATALFAVLGTSVVVFELAAGVLLWIPRYRRKTLVACFVMTTVFQVVLAVRAFGLLSYVLYLAFVPPELVHDVVDRLLGRGANRTATTE